MPASSSTRCRHGMTLSEIKRSLGTLFVSDAEDAPQVDEPLAEGGRVEVLLHLDDGDHIFELEEPCVLIRDPFALARPTAQVRPRR